MKFRIHFRSFDKEKIQLAVLQIQNLLEPYHQDNLCQISAVVALPKQIKKFCVLRSPHVNKDSREHFELRISKQFVDVIINSPSVLNSLLEAKIPDGVVCSLKYLSAKNFSGS
ncbi:MAG: 30S ribosomal protein S10 [Pedobacter sp.]|nr:MAG: 30S ribosomal protein S10 [Pedobacter sp.]